MPNYVKVHTGSLAIEDRKTMAAAPAANSGKPWVWREYVDAVPAHYDARIHTLTKIAPTLGVATFTENYTVTSKALTAAKNENTAAVRAAGEAKRRALDISGFVIPGGLLAVAEAHRWDATLLPFHTAENFPILEQVRLGRALSTLAGAQAYVLATELAARTAIAAASKPEEKAVKAIAAAADVTAIAVAVAAIDWSV